MRDKVIYECTVDEFFCSYDGMCNLVDDEKYNHYGVCYGYGLLEDYGLDVPDNKCPFFGVDPKSKVKIVLEVK